MIYLFNPVSLLIIYIVYTVIPKDNIFYKPWMYFGALVDFVVNVTWFTVIFLEFPKEWLLTKRVRRLKSADGFRGNLARLICRLLNHFEANHCA